MEEYHKLWKDRLDRYYIEYEGKRLYIDLDVNVKVSLGELLSWKEGDDE